MLKNIWKWLVVSSADADRLSTTIKGLIGFVPSLVVFLNLLKIDISVDALTSLFEFMGIFVSALVAAISAAVSIFGLVRKIYRTAKGEHLGMIS